ncbi:MAG: hypothetical protein E5V25_15220 [Mesorhizobium sp.]|jgi:hypothetical protein|uniref:hypothetical protein n=1 Tax=unclassified Mesorhizobium TaxID=325217 RepID=UPI000FCA2A93|nr:MULTISPECIES: hypothetical protein [unclassified Mesorhizobium]RUV70236.1 hypothetical protein EOA78_21250 [Mesorhizobium sp. M5C.F.Cr.IN.023.01.1.1]RWB31182.1 MAG: hypothetical protein EOQ43_12685 [Mesorhizobium sp.]RWB50437.1 MAG: hypothetical protein EOQ42_27205 [Mesorhizobium sp.]RWC33982.1 MAG: hypothetical protein EOS70_14820 [Mesorhizobium sp.]RWD19343.1 MAG: hypothetical protein EOS57_13045 [Mesorhizobium sp.]
MKTALLVVAALGLSVSGAAAECVGHSKTTASVDQQTKTASVDQQTKVASVANTPTTAETPILKKEEAKESE